MQKKEQKVCPNRSKRPIRVEKMKKKQRIAAQGGEKVCLWTEKRIKKRKKDFEFL